MQDTKGVLITFEGIDSAGKTTQIRLAAKALSEYNVVITKEPRDVFRSMLLDTDVYIDPYAELLMYEADRAQHMATVVKPALESGAIVISDRFIDSTVAYQGGGRRIPDYILHSLNRIASRGITPVLTVFIDIPPEEAVHRIQTPDRMESEGVRFMSDVRARYLELVKTTDRIVLFDGMLDIDTLHTQIMGRIRSVLENAL